MSKPQKSAGQGRKADSGNVVVDLGEKHSQKIDSMIERKLAAAGMAGVGRAGLGGRPFLASKSGYKPGSLSGRRPGLFGGGGFRPWYGGGASRFGRPWLGQEAAGGMSPGRSVWGLLPLQLQQVATHKALGGVALGILGNRAVARLSPMLWPSNTNQLVHEGIAFVAGLIPMLFSRNAMTLGVAIPGAVYLGGSLVDMLFTAVGMPPGLGAKNVAMRGSGSDAVLAARQKLAAFQNRVNAPAMASAHRPLPRVVAQQYA